MLFIAFILFILVACGLTVLAFENFSTNVTLSLVIWQTPPIPLGWLLLGVFFLGALLLYFISVASAANENRAIKRLRARVLELEQALQRVPSGPLTNTANAPTMPMPGMPGQDVSDMTTLH